MKKNVLLVYLILLSSVPLSHAQYKSLFATPTLYGAVNNPAQQLFTDRNSFMAVGLPLNVVSFDHSFRGHAKTVLTNAIYGDRQLPVENLRRSGLKGNNFRTKFEMNWMMMKILLNRKKGMELGLSLSTKVQSNIALRDELVDVFLAGNDPYIGKTIDGFFDTNSYLYAYHEAAISFRKNIDENWSYGLQVSFLKGISYTALSIYRSSIYFAPRDSGYYFDIEGYGGIEQAGAGLIDGSADRASSLTNLDGMGKNIALSVALSRKINAKLQLYAGLKDFGSIKWDKNGKKYTIAKKVRFEGVNVSNTGQIKDSILKSIPKVITDTVDATYTTILPARLTAGAEYKWNENVATRLMGECYLAENDAELHLMNNVRVYRNIHFILNTGLSINNYYQVGTEILVQSRAVDFFIGSEQIGNLFFTELSPGVNVNAGMAWRFRHHTAYDDFSKRLKRLKR